MAAPWQRSILCAVTAFFALLCNSIIGDEPAATIERRDDTAEVREQRAADLALLVKTADKYEIILSDEWPAKLNRQPSLRWNNAIAGTKDAALFLWMANDRPAVAGTMLWRPELGMFHEFQSLAEEGLEARCAGKTVWQVFKPGVRFAQVPDAPQPAVTSSKRLSQIKTIASKFGAEVVKGPPAYPDNSVWQLRLMPNPVARYGSEGKDVHDGVVFAFCQDTDPEVLLLIEARGGARELAWQFAFAPMTGWSAKAWNGKTTVWSQERLHPGTDPKLPYFVVGPVPKDNE